MRVEENRSGAFGIPGTHAILRREFLALIVLLGALWLPRALKLREFVTIDEPWWLARSANFTCALSQGDFAATFQREHPGVTTMWTGVLGFLWEAPEYREVCQDDVEEKEHEALFRALGLDPLALLGTARFFSVLIITLVLGLGFFYAWRLFDFWNAWFGFMLIALDPFHAAFSHLLHVDGLSSSFILLTLLAFLAYLDGDRLRDLVVSACAMGLACLAKSPAFFLFPFMGLLAVLDFLKMWLRRREEATPKEFWQTVGHLALWGCVAVVIFVGLWPAMWVDPIGTLTQVLEQANHYAVVGHRNPIFFNGQIIEDGNLGAEFYYFYPLTYLWRSTPVVLLGLLCALVAFVTSRGPFHEKALRLSVLRLILFVVLFTGFISFSGKKFDRYLLPAYPPLDLIAALGWMSAVSWLKQRELAVLRRWALRLVLGGAVLGQAFPLVQSFPYYLSYYNPWMGGSRRAPEVMQIGWGEGLDQAAAYLNAKPDAEDLEVYSWYNPGSFSYFFNGESDEIPESSLEDVEKGRAFFASDAYVVTYIHQWQRRESWHLLDYLALGEPEHTIWINGLEYARIYHISDYRAFYQDPGYRQVEVGVGEQIVLEGYALPQQVATGESIPVALSWRALSAPAERLKVFVHLLNAAGELVSQSDGEPMVAFRPTNTWQAGEQIADHYRVAVPEGLVPGTYTLRVGMYRENSDRLALTQSGEPLGDALTLGTIEVVKP